MNVRPRKLPTQRRSAATVECVLEAAAHILESEGLSALNTNAVARRAGISIGSLYQYFPGKDAITSALILRSHEAIVAGLQALLAETETMSAGDSIAAMLRMLLEIAPRSPRLNRILEAEEDRLARTDSILAAEREIERLNGEFFGRHIDPARCSDAQLAVAAGDVVAIVRSLLDSAALDTAEDRAALQARLQRTVEGYLAPLFRTATASA